MRRNEAFYIFHLKHLDWVSMQYACRLQTVFVNVQLNYVHEHSIDRD